MARLSADGDNVQKNANGKTPAHSGGRHARRVSYRGSDDYIISEVGAPDTVPFDSGADLSGFDKMVIGHAPEEYTVESVGVADPFQPDAAENYTRPFTTAFPDSDGNSINPTQGYSTFSDIAEYDPYAERMQSRSGQTALQSPLQVEEVGGFGNRSGRQGRNGGKPNKGQAEGPRSFDMPDKGRGDTHGDKKKPKKRRRGLKVFLGVLIALIAVCVVGFFVYTGLLDSALEKSERTSASNALKPTTFSEPFYMLVLGGDSPESANAGAGEPTYQRSDVILLVRVDPKGKVVTMVSIPRDTMYVKPDGTVTKINDCYYEGGAEEAVKAVSELTGVDISHYVSLSFDDLDEIVDAIGGVTVYVNTPIDQMMEGRRVVLDEGEKQLNGLEALAFARSRKNYDEYQDKNRQNNVRTLAEAIIGKVLDRPLLELPGTMLNLAHYVSTDLRSNDILGLAMAFGGSSGGMTVYNATGPYEGGILDEYDGYWYCYPNPEGWARLMEIVDAGEDPSGIEY